MLCATGCMASGHLMIEIERNSCSKTVDVLCCRKKAVTFILTSKLCINPEAIATSSFEVNIFKADGTV